ncbi:hypothetical protein [Adlercreutzia caecimuris]|uniref:hypothetical protein n=1 Tax=Adlercreutzia caecimuris TaxID=671266 RepID=UPI0012ED0157|nr:hypothetical protein [Adlercreutzia caecimuris]
MAVSHWPAIRPEKRSLHQHSAHDRNELMYMLTREIMIAIAGRPTLEMMERSIHNPHFPVYELRSFSSLEYIFALKSTRFGTDFRQHAPWIRKATITILSTSVTGIENLKVLLLIVSLHILVALIGQRSKIAILLPRNHHYRRSDQ